MAAEIEEIKRLYLKLDHKGKFIDLVAEDLNKASRYIRSHWFHLWRIPEEHLIRVKTLLEQVITLQEAFHSDYQKLISK